MNSAKLSRSDRLKRVLSVLSDGQAHTTMDIIKNASVCAVNSIISELRANGKDIECQRKGDVWYYWLRESEVCVYN